MCCIYFLVNNRWQKWPPRVLLLPWGCQATSRDAAHNAETDERKLLFTKNRFRPLTQNMSRATTSPCSSPVGDPPPRFISSVLPNKGVKWYSSVGMSSESWIVANFYHFCAPRQSRWGWMRTTPLSWKHWMQPEASSLTRRGQWLRRML